MKFSEDWLRELVNPPINTDQLVAQITLAGLEVDEALPVAAPFSNVVVGEILSAGPHPNADKLQVCQVTDGEQEWQVVCGAPNARAGLKTAFARVGAELTGPDGSVFKIKKAKLRQVESFGMLCADDELGISDDHGGIMELASDAPVGSCLRAYLKLDDTIVDVDLTPNRGDCLSISGLAREVGVLNKTAVTFPAITPVVPQNEDRFPVSISAGSACPRYVGRVVRNVNVAAETPLWMVEKLRRAGIRSIDPIVDITNYVLLELGQPMHAFDLAKLNGAIEVRLATQDEVLTLLDGQEIKLNADTLVIADQSGPLAMAGIMGGEGSGVNPETRDIFFESAFFAPLAIAGRARAYGLHTDSSHRFERGVDWQLQVSAMERATELLLEIAGGEPGPVVETVSEADLPAASVVTLRQAKVNQILAFEMPATEIEEIITRLGMQITATENGVWQVAVPSYRFDVSIEVDLIEELARVYGYDNLPVRTPVASMPLKPNDESKVTVQQLRRSLLTLGYQEAITYSFIDQRSQSLFDDQYQGVALANPISAEMAIMRTSIWPGLTKALQYNQNRQQTRIRMFETGQRFLPSESGMVQENVISGIITGKRDPEGWTAGRDSVDFFDIKGHVEALLALGGASNQFSISVGKHVALHPGQAAVVTRGEEVVGFFGAMHPSLVGAFDLNGPIYLFELRLEPLVRGALPKYQELSRFPESRRDIALIVEDQVEFDGLRQLALQQGGEYLKQVTLFDVYKGQGIEVGRKSLAIGLTFQHPSRTLNEEEVSGAVEAVANAAKTTFGAVLRE